MNTEYEGRGPDAQEVEAITVLFEGYEPPIIRVYDNYISDGPGYIGWVAITLGGEPEYVASFTKNHQGEIEICCEPGNWQLPADPNVLAEPLPTLLRQSAKVTGTHDPDEAMGYIEEQLTAEQYKICLEFLKWLTANDYTFGHNIQEVYKAFKTGDTSKIQHASKLCANLPTKIGVDHG